MRSKYNGVIKGVVKESKSWAEVCRKIGLKPDTGSQSYIKSVAVRNQVDYSHFTGQAWNRGKEFPELRRPVSYYLKLNGPFINSHVLRKKLIASELKKEKCEDCGLFEWMGEKPPLELDHLNDNRNDNRLSNLRISCPNCHALKTRKNRKLRSRGGTRQTRTA